MRQIAQFPSPRIIGRHGMNLTSSGGHVRLLDQHTVNQIAAGEVVERPAAALKELIENALDAGARRITVELADSGRTLIRVADDGCGMSAEDARSALMRHATSKITSAADLSLVRTLGFRGEALPSIASVSRMTLSTGDTDGMRTVLRVSDSEISALPAVGGPRGTEVSVEDLFYNTPARLKFLKSDTTELGQCIEVTSRYAIGYPDVAFELIHNGQRAFRTTGDGEMLQAISDVWGRDAAKVLAEVDTEAAGMRVRGFVSPPHTTKPTRSMQYLYVNGRPVRTRTVTVALDQAYRDLTPERRYPIVALMLEVDPGSIDANVSPTKSEVKFRHEGSVFDLLRLAVRSSLLQHGMMPSAAAVGHANEAARASSSGSFGFESSGPSGSFESLSEASLLAQAPLEVGAGEPVRCPFAELAQGLRILGQAMNTFIVAETDSGIAIIDQHVAHERVLYEYLCGIRGQAAIEKQPLLSPAPLHLDPRSAVLLRERLDELKAVGFDLEPFGGESYLIRAAPAAIGGKDPVRVLKDLVDELVEGSVSRRLAPTREQIWITSSCKMAVKAGDPLSLAEMEQLVLQLAETENPYLCPHGRPITITLTRDELFRKFKRT